MGSRKGAPPEKITTTTEGGRIKKVRPFEFPYQDREGVRREESTFCS